MITSPPPTHTTLVMISRANASSVVRVSASTASKQHRGRAPAAQAKQSRRSALLSGAGLAALLAAPAAQAKSLEDAERAKAERRAALRAAAEASATTGRAESAFADVVNSVSEDHSPNAHGHQDEGLKQQTNV
mmetsp:Transcript_12746/g.42041  ORF Transcript_12746/g.42041 Transcript_12746/m.42041 type:complete len:133 (+) Transcript_12746:882-1280(+)